MPGDFAGHANAFTYVILVTAIVFLAGTVGRWLAQGIGQPGIVGEIAVGIIIGNLGYWFGPPIFVMIMHLDVLGHVFAEVWHTGLSLADATEKVASPGELASVPEKLSSAMTGERGALYVVGGIALWLFSHLGVLLLLSLAGLHTSTDDMRALGGKTLPVAAVAVVAPLLLGLAVAHVLLPDESIETHLFVGVIMSATGIGITASILDEMGQDTSPEGRFILSAGFIDDVLAIIVLTVVVGLVTSGHVDGSKIVSVCALSAVFFTVVLLYGDRLAEMGVAVFRFLDPHTYRVVFPMFLLCVLAWLTEFIGLEAIVGSFAAGLILSEDKFRRFSDPGPSLENLLRSFESIFAPVFFVLMGMQVNLSALLEPGTVVLVVAMCGVLFVGNLFAGLAAAGEVDWRHLGFGLAPSGVEGLVFASIGKAVGAIPDSVFSAIVVTAVVTTFIAPIGLRWSFTRKN